MPLPHHSFRPGADPPRLRPDVDADPGFLFAELLEDLPEFVPRYLELVAACDDDPGEPLVLMELAEFVAARVAAITTEESVLDRAIGLVEALVDARQGDHTASEVLGYAFFDTFTVEHRRLLAPRLGSGSLGLLESLEAAPSEDRS